MNEFLDRPVFSLSTEDATVGMILAAILVTIVSLAVAWAIKRQWIRHFERHNAGDQETVQSVAKAKLIAAVILVFGLDKTISRGDVILVGEELMLIERIGLRSTIGRTGDGINVLIPNSTVAGARVENLTREDKLVRVTARVGVALDSDRPAVRSALEGIVADWPGSAAESESRVELEEFTSRSIVYLVSIWIDDVRDAKQARSELNEAIWRGLDEAGVSLA
jgi:small-conductance mechanosensitive channel